MGIKKKILSMFCCTLLIAGALGTNKSFADEKSVKIESGKTYVIESALKSNMVVDMSNNHHDANVHLWEYLNLSHQHWKIERTPWGYYNIINARNNNLYLVMNNKSTNYNVHAYDYSADKAYKVNWFIEDAGDGYVYLRHAEFEDKYLDVSSAGTSNGTNIGGYQKNGSSAQKFKLKEAKVNELTGRDYGFEYSNYYIKDYPGNWGMYWIGNKFFFSSDIDSFVPYLFKYDANAKAYTIKYFKGSPDDSYLSESYGSIVREHHTNTSHEYWVLVNMRTNQHGQHFYAIRNKATGAYLTRPGGGKNVSLSSDFNSMWNQTFILSRSLWSK